MSRITKLLRKVFPKLDNLPHSKTIKIAHDFVIGRYRTLSVDREANVTIAQGVLFREFVNIVAYKDAHLNIGQHVFFNNYCSINCLLAIDIGQNTIFGEGVRLYDHNHKYTYVKEMLNVQREQFNSAKISIGKNCWIGSNVVILKGVTIGDNVIVGANNLIYKSIPAGSIVKSQANVISKEFEQGA